MSYEFRPAVRDKTSVLIALAGASGSGKTYTAILLAFGLAYPGMNPAAILAAIETEGRSRVCFIDTEGGRGLHYAPGRGQDADFVNTFPLAYAEIVAPYTPESYQDAIMSADKVGFETVIIDSMSHEYESEGGIMEIADQIESGVLAPGKTLADTQDRANGWKAWAIKPVKSPGNWKEPKTRHKKMVNRAIQSRAHVIFCLRAEEKMLLRQVAELDERGEPKMWNGRARMKTEVVPAADRPLLERWQPICEKRFMYEMTVSFLMLPSAPGVGNPIKNLQDQFRPMFPEGAQLGVENGRLLAEWSHGRKLGGTKAVAHPETGMMDETPVEQTDKARISAQRMTDRYIAGMQTLNLDELREWQLEPRTVAWLEKLRDAQPDLHKMAMEAAKDRYSDLSSDDDVEFPADDDQERTLV